MTPEEQERIVNDAIETRTQAREVLGESYDFRGKTSRDVMLDVIKHVDSKLDLTKRSDEAVRAAYDVAIPRAREQRAAQAAQHLSVRGRGGELHTDSADDESYESTLNKNIAKASRRSA